MLDVLSTRKEDENLDFSVYRKPTHKISTFLLILITLDNIN